MVFSALNPLGPIFGKELRVTSRRKRSYALRVAFLGLLLLTLLMVYAAQGGRYGGIAQQAQRQAELGAEFFLAFSIFCICAMGLIAPVLTCTAIGSEKLAKTLPVLMMTPISSWQIVTGKLLSRLLAALTLLGLSLPVLALVRLLGGVELQQMIAVMCLCTSFAFSSAAMGLFYSTFMNRAFAVILLAYATQLFIYLFVPMIIAMLLARTRGPAAMNAMQFMFDVHPVAITAAISSPDMMGRIPFAINWGTCSLVQVGIAAGLLTLSGLVLRRVARRHGEGSTSVVPAFEPIPVAPTPGFRPAAPAASRETGSGPVMPPPLPAAQPILPYAGPSRHRPRAREVSDNPILWREIRRPLMAKRWMGIVAAAACILLLLITYAAMGWAEIFSSGSDRHGEQIGFAIVFSGLFWLVVSVLSATAIASEKESDTWTLLLATPLSGSAIVWGKVAGLLRRLFWPLVLVACHFILFTLAGHVPLLTTVYVLWVMVSFNSIWIATGLYLSLRMKRVTFAVITNLMLAVAAYAVVPAVLFVFERLLDLRDGRLAEHGTWHLPYMFLGNFLETEYRYNRWSAGLENYWLPGFRDHNVSQGLFLSATFAVGTIHLLVSYLILRRTATEFDSLVGRAGKNAHGATFDPEDVVTMSNSAGYASFWRRAVAFVIDTSIVQLGGGALGLVAGAAVLLLADPTGESPESVLGRYFTLGIVSSLLLGWVYYALFESSRRRATPGKSALGIFVTDADGRRTTFGRASMRYFAKLLSGLTMTVGYLLALFNPRKRTLHDMIADTLVLRR